MLTGTMYPELYRPWRPRARTSGLILLATAGAILWLHAYTTPNASWYTANGKSYAGLYELIGTIMVFTAAIGSIPALIMPWQAHRAAQSPIYITIGPKTLQASGRGQYEAIRVHQTYNSSGSITANADDLAGALDALLEKLGTRLKPFVVIQFEGNERPTPAEVVTIQNVIGACTNILDYTFDTPHCGEE